MAVQVVSRSKNRAKPGRLLLQPLALLVLLGAVGSFVAYVLWPTWPKAAISPEAPALPITVADVVFNIPPAAMRAAVQRYSGPHERIDLEFLWPSLVPPQAGKIAEEDVRRIDRGASNGAAAANENNRLFMSVAPRGAVMPPVKRLHTVYPRYTEAQASPGPDGLAVLSFRSGTPYEGEDLLYFAAQPEKFFVRCTRKFRLLPGTCMHERSLESAEITLRFQRDWLGNWRSLVAGFDRLIAQLHPQGE